MYIDKWLSVYIYYNLSISLSVDIVWPIYKSSVYVITCLYIISCLHTDFDCWVDSFTTEQFVPELLSDEFQTRLGPLWNRFKGPRRKHKQLTTMLNKSISTQIRQAKSVYIYRLYIYRHFYTYRLSLTFSAMSIYIDYIWERTRTRDTRLYSVQMRQAQSVYIHLDIFCNTHCNLHRNPHRNSHCNLSIYLTLLIHCMCAMTHNSFMCAMTPSYVSHISHSYACHDSFTTIPARQSIVLIYCMRATWNWFHVWDMVLIHCMCAMTHGSFRCVLHLIHTLYHIHMCAISHSYVCRISFIRVPWRIHMCVTSHSYVCHDAWLIHTCAILNTNVCHILYYIQTCAISHSFVCHITFICVPWRIHMCVTSHSHACHDSFTITPTLQSIWQYLSILCVPYEIGFMRDTRVHGGEDP